MEWTGEDEVSLSYQVSFNSESSWVLRFTEMTDWYQTCSCHDCGKNLDSYNVDRG